MKTSTSYPEFAPLEVERAKELKTILNGASCAEQAVLISPEGDGITGSAPADLISPEGSTNGLIRYQRHYDPRGSTRLGHPAIG